MLAERLLYNSLMRLVFLMIAMRERCTLQDGESWA